jgi:hypothetical protein
MFAIILATSALITAAPPDHCAKAGAALALAAAVTDTEKKAGKLCPFAIPNCKCGCADGKRCDCGVKKKDKTCPCSKQCVCGCNGGGKCGCQAVRVRPVAAAPVYYQPAYQPIYRPTIPMARPGGC